MGFPIYLPVPRLKLFAVSQVLASIMRGCRGKISLKSAVAAFLQNSGFNALKSLCVLRGKRRPT